VYKDEFSKVRSCIMESDSVGNIISPSLATAFSGANEEKAHNFSSSVSRLFRPMYNRSIFLSVAKYFPFTFPPLFSLFSFEEARKYFAPF
jgi:hypothetical protein